MTSEEVTSWRRLASRDTRPASGLLQLLRGLADAGAAGRGGKTAYLYTRTPRMW